ncbi:hypothetical protein GS891_00835 [Rhodococcus hoagii]|nr:hypothetical protein [Prescottella equi]
MTGLSSVKIRVQIDGSTYVSHSLSGGSGYTGTATATRRPAQTRQGTPIEITIPTWPRVHHFTPRRL